MSDAPPVGGKCPICGGSLAARYRPFCSRRCADVDLSRWLSGAYVIPDGNDGRDDGAEEGTAADDGGRGNGGEHDA
jgi:endogenous inhibitor of DNA gyrase (YacG/DUF329 family)